MKDQTILIVDDAFFIRNLLGDTIRNAGYKNIFFAQDGLEALDKASRLKPDLITLDISMPEMNGIEALGKITEVSPSSKVVMVSALSSRLMVIEALKAGAVDFISKPFNSELVEEVIKKHLS